MRLSNTYFKISILIILLVTFIIIIYIESNDLKSSKELTRIEPNYLIERKFNSFKHKCKLAIITKWKNESFIQWLVKGLQADKNFSIECLIKAYNLDNCNSASSQSKINEHQLEKLKEFKHILFNFKPNDLMLQLAKLIQDISAKTKIFYLLDFNLSFKHIETVRYIDEFNTSYFIVTTRSNYLTLKYSYGINTNKLILIKKSNLIEYRNLLRNFHYVYQEISVNKQLLRDTVYLNNSNLKKFVTNNLYQYYCLYSDTSVQINMQIDLSINLVSVGIVTQLEYVYAHAYSGIYLFESLSNSSTADSKNEYYFETTNLGLKLTIVKNSLTIQFLKLNSNFYAVGILARAFKELKSKKWNQISLKLYLSEFKKYKLQVNDIFSTKCDAYTLIKPIKKKKNNLVNFVIEGPVFSYSSFAVVNRKLYLALHDITNLNVLLKPEESDVIESDFEMLLIYHFYKQQEESLSLTRIVLFRNSGNFIERINWNKVYNNISNIKLVHHQPWEFHAVPVDWIRYFNEKCDEIWVPSSYNRLAYIENGINSNKIHAIPHGVFSNEFKSIKTDETLFLSSKKFKFLTIGGMVARKGIDLILDSYSSLFTNKDDVSLVIHCIYGDNYALEKLKSIQNRTNSPEIVYIKTKLSRKDVINLFKTSSVYLSPYRSEGFGLTILEAMASGLVPIVTNYGPSKEYCSLKCCYFVEAIETECRLHPCGNMSIFRYRTKYQPKWSEPYLSSIKKVMKNVYLNQDQLTIRRKACKFDAMKYTWEKAADKILKRIFELK